MVTQWQIVQIIRNELGEAARPTTRQATHHDIDRAASLIRDLLWKEIETMSDRETSPEIASLAARVLNEDPREGDQNLAFNALLVQAKKLAGSCLSQAEPEDGPDGPRILTTATVGWDKITNAITGAIEGGYCSWLHDFIANGDETSRKLRDKAKGGAHIVWYNDPSFWIGGGVATAGYDDPDDGKEGSNNGSKQITRSDLSEGLRLMAEKETTHFADLLAENDDGATHDVFMQCVILGEVVYG